MSIMSDLRRDGLSGGSRPEGLSILPQGCEPLLVWLENLEAIDPTQSRWTARWGVKGMLSTLDHLKDLNQAWHAHGEPLDHGQLDPRKWRHWMSLGKLYLKDRDCLPAFFCFRAGAAIAKERRDDSSEAEDFASQAVQGLVDYLRSCAELSAKVGLPPDLVTTAKALLDRPRKELESLPHAVLAKLDPCDSMRPIVAGGFATADPPSRESAKSSQEATTKAFERAHGARVHPDDEPYRPFNEVAYAWGAKRLWRGSEEGIWDLVRQNLDRISRGTNFGSFSIFMRDDSVVQISAHFRDFFIGVQLWRAKREYFTNGNGDFDATGSLARDERIRMESGEKQEADQAQRIQALREARVPLPHTLCGGSFSVEECEIVRVRDTSVTFWCPKCRVQALHSLK